MICPATQHSYSALRTGDIELGDPGTPHGDLDGEGYQLDTTTSGVTLEAITPHGLYNGVQTIRQLLPAWIVSSSVEPGPWTMPAAADVGYSAMCPAGTSTWAIMTAIVDQLTAMSPGPYYDIGGDEVPTTLLSQSQYASFVNSEAGIVQGQAKTVLGWADEYWNPASGTASGTSTATGAVAKGMKVVMAPASHAYLDQRVEGTIFGETVVTLSDVDYMVFPRLQALAEIGWSR